MPRYLGDYRSTQTIDFTFTTLSTALTGAPGALSSADITVYKGNSATQSTAGLVLTSTFDSITGLNHVRISTSADGTFYSDAADYNVILSAGAVGSVSLVGYTLASFSITNRTVSSTAMISIADALLNRDMIIGTDSGTSTFRTVRQALRFLRNKWEVNSTNRLTVYAEDDSATSWTAQLTVSSSASPITGTDPTG